MPLCEQTVVLLAAFVCTLRGGPNILRRDCVVFVLTIKYKESAWYSATIASFHVLANPLFTTTTSRPVLEPIHLPLSWLPVVSFLGVKRPGREVDHSPPSSAAVNKIWSYILLHLYAFMAWTGKAVPLPSPTSCLLVVAVQPDLLTVSLNKARLKQCRPKGSDSH